MSKIRVLSVDDSALMRQIMTEIINSHSDMEMVATAPDPLVARDLIKKYNPDVLTLDVEMPRMDGLDFLEKLMRLRPMPVVMVSSLTGKGSEVTLRALELGAIDFVTGKTVGARAGCRTRYVKGRAAAQFRKTARHWRVNRRHRGDSPRAATAAALMPGGVDHLAYAARFYPFVCRAPEQTVSD